MSGWSIASYSILSSASATAPSTKKPTASSPNTPKYSSSHFIPVPPRLRRALSPRLSDAARALPLLHDEPPPLLVAETEGLHRERFGRSLVRCLDGPKMVGTRSQNLHAPSPQLGGGVLPSH